MTLRCGGHCCQIPSLASKAFEASSVVAPLKVLSDMLWPTILKVVYLSLFLRYPTLNQFSCTIQGDYMSFFYVWRFSQSESSSSCLSGSFESIAQMGGANPCRAGKLSGYFVSEHHMTKISSIELLVGVSASFSVLREGSRTWERESTQKKSSGLMERQWTLLWESGMGAGMIMLINKRPQCLSLDIARPSHPGWGSQTVAQWSSIHLPTQETRVQSLVGIDPLEWEMTAHSSILAWKVPWTEEYGRLQSMGPQRGRQDWAPGQQQPPPRTGPSAQTRPPHVPSPWLLPSWASSGSWIQEILTSPSLVSPLCELGITVPRSCGVGLDRLTWAKVRHQRPNAIHLQDVQSQSPMCYHEA